MIKNYDITRIKNEYRHKNKNEFKLFETDKVQDDKNIINLIESNIENNRYVTRYFNILFNESYKTNNNYKRISEILFLKCNKSILEKHYIDILYKNKSQLTENDLTMLKKILIYRGLFIKEITNNLDNSSEKDIVIKKTLIDKEINLDEFKDDIFPEVREYLVEKNLYINYLRYDESPKVICKLIQNGYFIEDHLFTKNQEIAIEIIKQNRNLGYFMKSNNPLISALAHKALELQ